MQVSLILGFLFLLKKFRNSFDLKRERERDPNHRENNYEQITNVENTPRSGFRAIVFANGSLNRLSRFWTQLVIQPVYVISLIACCYMSNTP